MMSSLYQHIELSQGAKGINESRMVQVKQVVEVNTGNVEDFVTQSAHSCIHLLNCTTDLL